MMDQKNSTLLAIAFFLLSVVVLLFLLFIALPLISAFLATCLAYAYHISSTRNKNEGGQFGRSMINSALYTGRVWHTRLHPKKHAFTYPIFMFALDLEELAEFRNTLWPLSTWLVKFRETDHLKNGEGIMGNNNQDRSRSSPQSHENKTNYSSDNANANNNNNGNNINGTTAVLERTSIGDRIMRLVAEKTNSKFQPTLQTHRVMILTHLCYYGYNFNPVSFYYIIDKKSKNNNDIAAIVGEVSNTPWLQQYCYVLHPDSIDKVKTNIQHDDDNDDDDDDEQMKKKVEYSFPKAFHVSPFMEMDYFYDWSFIGIPGAVITSDSSDTNATNIKSSKSVTVVNTLRRRNNNRIEFTAKLIMESNPITPFRVAKQMIIFPVYCMIIQIWIHYQAILLFLKGVVYIPHPLGSETAASAIIAKIMIPFFVIQDYFKPKTKSA